MQKRRSQWRGHLQLEQSRQLYSYFEARTLPSSLHREWQRARAQKKLPPWLCVRHFQTSEIYGKSMLTMILIDLKFATF
jgi:hypothetical protein